MQAVDRVGKKSILVDAETHRRIVALRKGKQTYGDVVADSVRALEDELKVADIPCIDDIPMEEIERREKEAMEHPELCFSLDDVMRARAEKKGMKYV